MGWRKTKANDVLGRLRGQSTLRCGRFTGPIRGRAKIAPSTRARTFVLLERESQHATLATMDDLTSQIVAGQSPAATRPHRLFYQLFLPLGVLANVALGVVILVGLNPTGWSGWLQLGTGAFCCIVAGWLSAAAWSKVYWNRSMARQVAVWRQIADAFFTWLEDAPLPAEAVHRLNASLDRVVPHSRQSQG